MFWPSIQPRSRRPDRKACHRRASDGSEALFVKIPTWYTFPGCCLGGERRGEEDEGEEGDGKEGHGPPPDSRDAMPGGGARHRRGSQFPFAPSTRVTSSAAS